MNTLKISAWAFFLATCIPVLSFAYSNNQAADVEVGQEYMNYNYSNYPALGANTLYSPSGVYSDGTRLFVADTSNHRVLIYNSIPTSNFASADVEVGQEYMNYNYSNYPTLGANTLSSPAGVYSDGTRLFIADTGNHRVLIYNTIPTSNFASANIEVGQEYMNYNYSNYPTLGANTLSSPAGVCSDGTQRIPATTGC
jgi:hypothetical protein